MNNLGLKDEVQEEIVLRLQNVSKIYPGTIALHKVNMEIRSGEVHGIIGKNGAGKSTLVGIIAGIIEPSAGEIMIREKKYKSLTRVAAKRERIAVVPQEPQVILDLSVAENLFLGEYRSNSFMNWAELYEKAEQVIKRVNLNIDARAKARDLSLSEQQLLLALKACYVEDAQLVILDEATASLSQDDEKLLHKIIAERKKEGKTVIIISHRIDELLKLCDRVTVIRDGKSVGTYQCKTLNKETLSSLIVGEGFKFKTAEEIRDMYSNKSIGEVVLSVEGLTKLPAYKSISFTLRKGEIVGFAGLRGSGRTEIFKGIAGIDPADEGSVVISGVRTRFNSPSQALKHGIVYLPEDREKEGLILSHAVKENLVLNALHKISRNNIINIAAERNFAENIVKSLGIQVASVDQEVSQLSGGNKQKVVVGRISAADPTVFLLDECTRGVDIAAKDSILSIVREKLATSAGIIMSSPGVDDLIMICDRILVLYEGEIVAEFSRDEFDEQTIFMAMQGEYSKK